MVNTTCNRKKKGAEKAFRKYAPLTVNKYLNGLKPGQIRVAPLKNGQVDGVPLAFLRDALPKGATMIVTDDNVIFGSPKSA